MGKMSAKFALSVVGVAILAVLVYCAALPGCKRPWEWLGPVQPTPTPEGTPSPTSSPTPKPTPINIPQKRLEVSKLFNGMEVHTKVESEPGGSASLERETPGSYELELSVKVKIPKPSRDLETLCKVNDALPTVLPALSEMLPQAKVSQKYEALYGRKLAQLQRNLSRLDLLLTRHNFFDCETILELRHPQTQRTAILLQADMDVDTDGSDPDRLPAVDAADPTYQPMTSYRWPKQTELTNPFLPGRQARLRALEAEYTQAKHMGEPRLQALRDAVAAARYEVDLLKTHSFLLAATDPFVVLPGLLTEGMDPAFQIRLGDYCAVIHGNTIYPAIVGDVGPRDLAGEASIRIGKEINSETTALHRAVSPLKVTYLFFPNSADKPFGPPDLVKWRARVEALLNEMGGYGGTLHTWVNLSKPAPTPTPTPSPTPTPVPPWLPPTLPLSGTTSLVAPTTTGTAPVLPIAPATAPTTSGTAPLLVPPPSGEQPKISPSPSPSPSVSPKPKTSTSPASKPATSPKKTE